MNSSFVSLSLKLIGVIFILSALLDYVTLAVPPQWQNAQWQINFATSIVDRGIVPLVGIAVLLIAYWIESVGDKVQKGGLDLRLPVYILSILLGALFIVLIPLHLTNLSKVQTSAISEIQKGSEQGKGQIESFLVNLNALAQNPQLLTKQIQQLTTLIETGEFQGKKLTPQQLEQLQKQKDDLQKLNELAKDPKKLKEEVETIKTKLQTRLITQKQEAEGKANTETLKQGLRTGLSSLMLAVAYGTVGALGWMNRGPSVRSKASPR